MTRKIIAIFAALLLTASLCACDKNPTGDEETTTGSKINIGNEETTSDNTESEKVTDTETEAPTETETETEPVEIAFNEQKDTVYVISSTNQVNLRSDTIIDESTAKGVVTNGTALERVAISEDGSWSKVVVDGEELYIKSTYVTTRKDLDEGFVATSKTLTLAGSLYVRIAPSMDNEAIDTLYAGDVVEVVSYNRDLGWYKVTFNGTYASEGYIVSASKYFVEQDEETDAPQVEITVPDDCEAFADTAIAFAYPEGWVDVPGQIAMKQNATTGDNFSVIYEPYTTDYDMYFSLDKAGFEQIFLPMYNELGYSVTDYDVVQKTKGDTKVAVMTFTNTVEGITMYMTQYVFVVNSNVCTMTVTELSADTTIAEDIFESLIIAK